MVLSMDYIRECLARNLIMRRTFLHLSQEGLADRAGLSSGFIANLERGKSWVSPTSLEKLSKALDTEPWKLLQDPQINQRGYTKEELSMLWERAKSEFFSGL
jgi:Predicted transcriptional regulator with C-terminal CBS domains